MARANGSLGPDCGSHFGEPASDAGARVGGKIVVSGTGIHPESLAPLRRRGWRIRRLVSVLSEAELARELGDAVGYLHGGEEYVTAAVLSGATQLQVIAFLGVGYETFVDVAAAKELNIVVTNTPNAATDSVAAFTVGQLINANWSIRQHLDKRLPDWETAEQLPHELSARRIGIVGLGAIGTRIAEILTVAFNSEVSYFSRTRKRQEEVRLGVAYLPLHELAEWSDIVVVMVPGNEKTRHMIDAGVLARMRAGTIIVNTARPALVDPVALHSALAEGRVSRAVFDGFYTSDVEYAVRLRQDFPDRLLVTGHIASHTQEAMNRMVRQAVCSIENILTGLPERNVVVGRAPVR